MTDYIGEISSVEKAIVSGWVYKAGDPMIPLRVDIILDQKCVRTVPCCFENASAADQVAKQHNCGFRANISDYLQQGQVQRIQVRVSGTEHYLSHGQSVQDVTLKGEIEPLQGLTLRGWAWDSERPDEAVLLDVYDNGVKLAEVKAEGFHTSLRDKGIGNGRHGFSIQLPDTLIDGAQHVIQLRDPVSGYVLPGKAVFNGERFCEGNFDNFPPHTPHATVVATGWAWEKTSPQTVLTIGIYQGDNCIAQGEATHFRKDLLNTKRGTGFYGFHIPLPDLPHDEEITLSARIMETGEELRGSPKTIMLPSSKASLSSRNLNLDQPVFEGRLERIDGREISGWAWDACRPNSAIEVSVFCDGHFVCNAIAGEYRPDLRFNDKGNGKHAFLIEVPEQYADGKPHNIHIYVAGTDHALAGSPQKAVLGHATIRHIPANKTSAEIASLYADNPLRYVAPEDLANPAFPPKVSVIILNRNGGKLLNDLFASFIRYNRYSHIEYIVVDHASEDNSLALLDEWKKKLPLTIVPCDQNYSFSYSNNRAAEQASGEYLFFLNNDIISIQDMITPLVDILQDPDVGMVGIRLDDMLIEEGAIQEPNIQHLGVKFTYEKGRNTFKPQDVTFSSNGAGQIYQPTLSPVVTGAAFMVRREEFLSLGGFCEEYFYGYEDVDLGLTYSLIKQKKVVCANDVTALHHRGYSRFYMDVEVVQRMRNNLSVLEKRFGYHTHRHYLQSLFSGDRYFTEHKLRIAFAVTEADMATFAGDYFTARDLAEELVQHHPCEVVYLAKDVDWYDLSHVDVLITLRHDYDLNQIRNAKPTLMKAAWIRNWVHAWPESSWFHRYDSVLCSSETACDHIKAVARREAKLLRIGTSPRYFEPASPRNDLASDYCFTGSFFGYRRDVMQCLDPSRLPYEFALYGHNWEGHQSFEEYYRGSLPYTDMQSVYASTKLVIDDANHVTKEWGSTNSRVFDALAAGVLVITNSERSSQESFDGLLPVYGNQEELESLLHTYLGNDRKRKALVKKLQKIVKQQHTYTHRAQELYDHLEGFFGKQYRISLKIPVPNWEEAHQWGDYHFACALRYALEKQGHYVRLDCLKEWDDPKSKHDDVVIVLRGLSTYTPKPGRINIMWNISHPDDVSEREYNRYDHVCVASSLHAEYLKTRLDVPVSTLLQCTDPELFHPVEVEEQIAHDVLFVGNSRKIYRKSVAYCLDQGIMPEVYGADWEDLIPGEYIKSEHIENQELCRHYAGAQIVLNDHWDSMARYGFISNRIFDAAASGAFILSDEVAGMSELFGDAIVTYDSPESLAKQVKYYSRYPSRRQKKAQQLREIVSKEHSFDCRASELLEIIDGLHEMRYQGVCHTVPKYKKAA